MLKVNELGVLETWKSKLFFIMNKLLKTCKVGVFCYYLTLVWAFSLYPRDELTLGGRQEGRELRNTEELKSVGFGLRPVFECHP